MMGEQDVVPWDTLNLRLPWELTCRIACQAMIERRSFDETVEDALGKYLEGSKKFARGSSE